MEKEKEDKFLKLLGAAGTREILEFLGERSTVQYGEMTGFVSTPTLNLRLRDLLQLGLISHHMKREETRKEWYEITEKGEKVLQHLKVLMQLTEGG
ncbi:MAG: winged helix-turn-helix transcriptional regulator [Theionarchaea archaeon]|nr:winged helix-turn-helix transcriptional regulator [Theionarchaea archaeon]